MLEPIDSTIPLRTSPPLLRGDGTTEFLRHWLQFAAEEIASIAPPAVQAPSGTERQDESTAASPDEFVENQTVAIQEPACPPDPPCPASGDSRDRMPAADSIAAAFFDLKLQPIAASGVAIPESTSPVAPSKILSESIEAAAPSHPSVSSESQDSPVISPLGASPLAVGTSAESGDLPLAAAPVERASPENSAPASSNSESAHEARPAQPLAITNDHPSDESVSSHRPEVLPRPNEATPLAAPNTRSGVPHYFPHIAPKHEGQRTSKPAAAVPPADQVAGQREPSPNSSHDVTTHSDDSGTITKIRTPASDPGYPTSTVRLETPAKPPQDTAQVPQTVARASVVAHPATVSEGPSTERPTSAAPPKQLRTSAEVAPLAQIGPGSDVGSSQQANLHPRPSPPAIVATSYSRAEVSNQIITAVIDRSSGTIELALAPEELGQLRIQLKSEGEITRVILHANREETVDFLKRHAADLEQDFGASGFSNAQFSFEHTPAAADDEEPLFALPSPSEGPSRSRAIAGMGGRHLDLRL